MEVELRNIDKRFGAVHANRDVSLDIHAGEVLALLGENGAGKSTLMKILYGFYRMDGGAILIDGRETEIDSPRAAMAAGIGMVFQQFSLIPALSVRENLALAFPKTPWLQTRKRTERVLTRLRVFAPDIDPETPVHALSVGAQQQVELVKVLNLEARAIVEPAGALALAGLKRYVARERCRGKSLVAICSGANMNFDRLRYVAERAEIGERREAIFAATIPERPGSFRQFCEAIGARQITEFNYRYAGADEAHVYVGVQTAGNQRQALYAELRRHGYAVVDLTDSEAAKLHLRHMVGGHGALPDELVYRDRKSVV